MKCARGRSQRSSSDTQRTASTPTAASVFTTGSAWSLLTSSPPTERRPAPGSLDSNTSWLVSAMKTVWPGGNAPVINILYSTVQSPHNIHWLFSHYVMMCVLHPKLIYLPISVECQEDTEHKNAILWQQKKWTGWSVRFSLDSGPTWLQQTFSEADKNGDGALSIGEVHQLLHKLNVNLPKQKVREMFQVRSHLFKT